jgi:integrase
MKKVLERLPKDIHVVDVYKSLSEKNKQLIDKYLEYKSGYVCLHQVQKLKYTLSRIADILEIDFDKVTREEMDKLGGIILKSTFTTKTQEDFICSIKGAYKFWFGENEFFPKIVLGLKRPKSRTSLRLPKDMLTEEQIYQMIKVCPQSRDKFFVALCGLDGALRPCEARNIRWGDVRKDKYGFYITIYTAKKSGNKETRVIRIIKSEPYFVQWNKDYPGEKKDEAYLFVNFENLRPIQKGTIDMLFKRIKRRLNWPGKRVFPYLMRHSLITKMSKDPRIPVAVLKKFIGHSLRSNTIAEYQHFGDDDLMAMQLEYNDIKKKEEDKPIEHKPIICSKCNNSNEYDAEFCNFCNTALSQKRMIENTEKLTELQQQYETLAIELEKRKKLDPLLDNLMSNPKVLELLNH